MKPAQLLLILLLPVFAMSQTCEGWIGNLGQPGFFEMARTMAYDSTYDVLYVGDPLRFAGDDSVEKVGAYQDGRWHFVADFKCTSCGSGDIESIVIADSGRVFIAGFFEGATDINGNYVASENVIEYNFLTKRLSPLGFGLEADRVYALAWQSDTLWAAGRITKAKNTGGDINVNNIAYFDESSQMWHAMGQGIGTHGLSTDDNGDVSSLALGDNGTVYAAGRFSKINTQDTVFSIAQWSRTGGWSAVGDGLYQAYSSTTRKGPALVFDIAYNTNTQTLFATGYMGLAIGGPNGLASWNGSQWTYMPGFGKPNSTGGQYQGYELYVDEKNDKLYVGGSFNLVDHNPANPPAGNHIAVFDETTSAWDSLGAGITSSPSGSNVSAITERKGEILVSGSFTEIAYQPANAFAVFQEKDTSWHAFSQGAHEPCDEINALGYLGFFEQKMIVGGKFKAIGDTYATSIAQYDPKEGWSKFHGAELTGHGFNAAVVHDIFIPDWPGRLSPVAVVGNFDSLYQREQFVNAGRHSPGFYKYETALALWVPMLNQLGGGQNVYAVDYRKGSYLIGGDFTSIDGIPIEGLAQRDDATGTWTSFASIGGGSVRDILVVDDSLVYIGGTFSTVNNVPMAGIAVYDGTSWSALGQNFGFQNDVYALAWDSLTQELVVGGQIEDVYQADGSSINSPGLAFWDGTSWSSRGGVDAIATNPAQYAFRVYSIKTTGNGTVYIGGEFSGIDGVSADRVAQYIPNTGWQPLIGGGVHGDACFLNRLPAVKALEVVDSDNILYLGGTFNKSGNYQSGKFAVHRLGTPRYVPVIDSMKTWCSFTEVFADSGFNNIQWSSGSSGLSVRLDTNFMDKSDKWLFVSAEKDNCIYIDSLLLRAGVNFMGFIKPAFEVHIDTASLTVGVTFVHDPTYANTLIWNWGDATGSIRMDNDLAPFPDTFYHTYAQAGVYKILLKADNGIVTTTCGLKTYEVEVNLNPTGIDLENIAQLNVYPNPHEGQFTLIYKGERAGNQVKVSVLDITGRIVLKRAIDRQLLAAGYTVMMENQPAGTYFLKLVDGDKIGRKLMILR